MDFTCSSKEFFFKEASRFCDLKHYKCTGRFIYSWVQCYSIQTDRQKHGVWGGIAIYTWYHQSLLWV